MRFPFAKSLVSKIEKNGFVLALQADVENPIAIGVFSDHRRSPRRRIDQIQHRVGFVQRFALEIGAGHQTRQDAAGQKVDGEMRGLLHIAAPRPGQRFGLEGDEAIAALAVGAGASVAREFFRGCRAQPSVTGAPVPSVIFPVSTIFSPSAPNRVRSAISGCSIKAQ
jgi:hypothetical protein